MKAKYDPQDIREFLFVDEYTESFEQFQRDMDELRERMNQSYGMRSDNIRVDPKPTAEEIRRRQEEFQESMRKYGRAYWSPSRGAQAEFFGKIAPPPPEPISRHEALRKYYASLTYFCQGCGARLSAAKVLQERRRYPPVSTPGVMQVEYFHYYHIRQGTGRKVYEEVTCGPMILEVN